jgi:hypothetical protein
MISRSVGLGGEVAVLKAAQYWLAYNVATGFDTVDFVLRARTFLQSIDIDPEIQVTDEGGFQRIRVAVPESLGTIASFRLLPLNRHLACQRSRNEHLRIRGHAVDNPPDPA